LASPEFSTFYCIPQITGNQAGVLVARIAVGFAGLLDKGQIDAGLGMGATGPTHPVAQVSLVQRVAT
jgi:hypothetical protein